MKENRKDCSMRHENGNCTVAGGFCTAVNDSICEALHNAFDCGYRSALRSKQDRNDWICTLKCTALMEEGMCSHGGLCCLYESQRTIKENDPLTLDELRMMSGDPAFVVTDRLKEWCIVHSHHSDDVIGGGIIMTRRTAEKRTYPYACYGENWLAYRQKPEEGTV